jgi:hypothetical protein
MLCQEKSGNPYICSGQIDMWKKPTTCGIRLARWFLMNYPTLTWSMTKVGFVRPVLDQRVNLLHRVPGRFSLFFSTIVTGWVCKNIAQNVAQPGFCQINTYRSSTLEKKLPKIRVIYIILKYTQSKNQHLVEKSPNLATLLSSNHFTNWIWRLGGDKCFSNTLPADEVIHRVARWFVFKPKIQIWVNFGMSCSGRWWYIGPFDGILLYLWTLGIVRDDLVDFFPF